MFCGIEYAYFNSKLIETLPTYDRLRGPGSLGVLCRLRTYPSSESGSGLPISKVDVSLSLLCAFVYLQIVSPFASVFQFVLKVLDAHLSVFVSCQSSHTSRFTNSP